MIGVRTICYSGRTDKKTGVYKVDFPPPSPGGNKIKLLRKKIKWRRREGVGNKGKGLGNGGRKEIKLKNGKIEVKLCAIRCWFVGRLVCYNFLKGREVSLLTHAPIGAVV